VRLSTVDGISHFAFRFLTLPTLFSVRTASDHAAAFPVGPISRQVFFSV